MSIHLKKNIILKISEYYRESNRQNRWRNKWNFDPNIKIGDKNVSIFDTNTICESLFQHGYEYLNLQTFFLNPFLRNVSTMRFAFAEIIKENYVNDYQINRVAFILKPEEVKDHAIFTACENIIYIDDRLLDVQIKDEITLYKFLKFNIRLRTILREKLPMIVFLKMVDLLAKPHFSLHSLYIYAIINDTFNYQKYKWLRDFMIEKYHYHMGIPILVPEKNKMFLKHSCLEETKFHEFSCLIIDLINKIEINLDFNGNRKVVDIQGFFIALLKDSIVELQQEYQTSKKFASTKLLNKIIIENKGVIEEIKAKVMDRFSEHL